MLTSLGRYQEAIKDASVVLKTNPKCEISFFAWSLNFLFLGHYEEALINVNSALVI
jgi:tetratricopeptide (TPR) repeat protein